MRTGLMLMDLVSRRTSSVFALLAYTIASMVSFGSFVSWSRNSLGTGSDPTTYIWGLNWWSWAIAHGVNPLVSNFVWYPDGFHLTWADLAPAATLIGLPIILLGGAALAFNIFMLLAPAAAAWCSFLLMRYLTRDWLASLIAGYLFGFSSYQLAHMMGHLSLVVTFVVPLVLLLVIKRLSGEVSRRRFIILFALCSLVQFGFSLEILATSCLFGTSAWVAALLLARSSERKALYTLALDAGCAALAVVLITLPWLISMWEGAADVPDAVLSSAKTYSADLLNFIAPTDLTYITSPRLMSISRRFSGDLSEQGAYLGLPLIVSFILWLRGNWNTRIGWMLLFMTLLPAVLSFGPFLTVDGTQIHIWTPWRVLLRLPLIRGALPVRFCLYVSLSMSIACGLWLAAAQTARGRIGRIALGVLAVLFVLPNPTMFVWAPIEFVPFFEKATMTRVLGKMPNLVVLPFAWGPSLIWQWQSGMAFRLAGGYLGGIPPKALAWPAVVTFLVDKVGVNFANDVALYTATQGINAIIAGPGTEDALIHALSGLNWQAEEVGGVLVYHVPDASHAAYYRIDGQYWETPTPWSWMGGNATITAVGRDYEIAVRGASRPPSIGPATVQIARGTEVTTEVIYHDKALAIHLPAGSQIAISTMSVFVPDRILYNGDKRELSVELSVTEPPSGRR